MSCPDVQNVRLGSYVTFLAISYYFNSTQTTSTDGSCGCDLAVISKIRTGAGHLYILACFMYFRCKKAKYAGPLSQGTVLQCTNSFRVPLSLTKENCRAEFRQTEDDHHVHFSLSFGLNFSTWFIFIHDPSISLTTISHSHISVKKNLLNV